MFLFFFSVSLEHASERNPACRKVGQPGSKVTGGSGTLQGSAEVCYESFMRKESGGGNFPLETPGY